MVAAENHAAGAVAVVKEAGVAKEEAVVDVGRRKFIALFEIVDSAIVATPCHGTAARYLRNCRGLLSRLPSRKLNDC